MQQKTKLFLTTVLLALSILSVFWSTLGQRRAPAPGRLRVLFLGDSGHHKPADRFQQLKPVLEARGFEIVYTDKLDDLNPQILKTFEALIIYANHKEITRQQEHALLNYVAAGGAFIPIHCASFCFQNSNKYIELVGAQFKSHGVGVFRASIIDPTHPVIQGMQEFETWDETYVHHRHNPDRRVLMVRQDNEHQEPWTWVRNYEKGRIFYTAYGHDARTWSNPGFQQLLEQGIRWAARRDRSHRSPETGRQAKSTPFQYTEATIPNYIPDQPGRSAEPLGRMQLPLEPQESMRHMRLPDGFEVRLFAAEPDIVKPIAMAWDARGRLWIAETLDYPNEKQPDGKGRDRIKICEDTDGDGRADKFTVFADGLSIPTSLTPANGGVVVAQAPDILFLKDTDGDDRADVRRVLFSGWETWDTHAGPSNLRSGFDNWVWGTVGYSGFKGTVGGRSREFRQGFFRFRPDGSELEFLGSTSNNTWGLGFGEDGFVFGSTANNQHSVFLGIPNRHYESVHGWSARRAPGIADHWKFHPLRDVVRQVDWHGGYTAAAGHALYTARSFPKAYWNRVAFVCEPTGSLVHACVVGQQGSHFVSHDAENLLVSDDEWTAPVAAEVGPDGALWVSDWYNFIVQHNPTPHGFATGKGNAYETPLRDKKYGRIYRIIYSAAKPSATLNLERATPGELVEVLRHENMFWRLTAQRLLYERGKKDILPRLANLVRDRRIDDIGLNPGAFHALWLMDGLGAFNDADPSAMSLAVEALHHPAASVRRAALQVLPRTSESLKAVLQSGSLQDAAQVRLAALLAISEMPASPEAGRALVQLLNKPDNVKDRWIPDGIAAAGARHHLGFLGALSELRLETMSRTGKQVNLIANPSFEDAISGWPAAWGFRTVNGKADHQLARSGRTGTRSVVISSLQGGSARWGSTTEVDPYTKYHLSGWIKTNRVARWTGMGALLEVQPLEENSSTASLDGTSGWRKVDITFSTGAQSTVRINCVLGGSGASRGTAWFDDIELQEVDSELERRSARVIQIVAADYAHRAPDDGALSLLKSLRKADVAFSQAALDGLVQGWPAGHAPKLGDAERAELVLLLNQFPDEARESLLLLAGRWGRLDIFSAALPVVLDNLTKQVGDASVPSQERIGAARRLIRLRSGPETFAVLFRHITPEAPLNLVDGLINSLNESSSPEVASALIGHWDNLSPASRRTAIGVLLRRPTWTVVLLDAIEKQKVDDGELNTEQAQRLTTHADRQIAERAKRLVASSGRAVNPDRQKVVSRMLAAAHQVGNAVQGKRVFAKNCVRCHTFKGVGRNIGPDLTGIRTRSRADILVDILDPSRSVEGNYRLWIISTKDGQTFTGQLESETQTAVELVETSGEKQTLQRKDIAEIRSSRMSIMPDGLEKGLSAFDLASLLQYLTGESRRARK